MPPKRTFVTGRSQSFFYTPPWRIDYISGVQLCKKNISQEPYSFVLSETLKKRYFQGFDVNLLFVGSCSSGPGNLQPLGAA